MCILTYHQPDHSQSTLACDIAWYNVRAEKNRLVMDAFVQLVYVAARSPVAYWSVSWVRNYTQHNAYILKVYSWAKVSG